MSESDDASDRAKFIKCIKTASEALSNANLYISGAADADLSAHDLYNLRMGLGGYATEDD